MTPKNLYKYRAFDSLSLRLLCESESWYANFSSFNDPLDGMIELINDVDMRQLEQLHDHFHNGNGAGLRNNYRWTQTEDGEFEESHSDYIRRIVNDIRSKLEESFDTRGILTLSERWDSPLLWSHYADKHTGFCIEYDATDHRCKYIQKVQYGLQQGAKISDLYAWKIEKKESGLESTIDAIFFSKATDWAYESEWRDISRQRGTHSAPFMISGVIFGLRCPSQVRTAIMLSFEGTGGKSPDFYEAYFRQSTFEMGRRSIDPTEEAYVRPSPSMIFGKQEDPKLPFDVMD